MLLNFSPKLCLEKDWDDTIDQEATGVRLRYMRQLHNLKVQQSLSDALRTLGYTVSIVSISKWEKGKSVPSIDHLIALRRLYSCRMEDLIVTKRESQNHHDDNDA